MSERFGDARKNCNALGRRLIVDRRHFGIVTLISHSPAAVMYPFTVCETPPMVTVIGETVCPYGGLTTNPAGLFVRAP